MNLEKRTLKARTKDMAGGSEGMKGWQIASGVISGLTALYHVINTATEVYLDHQKMKEAEKTTKILESKMNEIFLVLLKQMEPIHTVFRKLEKFQLCELHLFFSADPEEELGKKEKEIARALESMLKENIQDLTQRIQTLDKDVHEWLESTKRDLQLLRADLEKIRGKKEEEIAMALESLMMRKFQDVSQRIQTLDKDVYEWPESTKRDLQLLRANLEKIRGKKEDEVASALESRIDILFQHLSQRIQTPGEDLRKRKGFRMP